MLDILCHVWLVLRYLVIRTKGLLDDNSAEHAIYLISIPELLYSVALPCVRHAQSLHTLGSAASISDFKYVLVAC